MTDALIVENDEAYTLAHRIAGRLGTSVDETVVEALRDYDRRIPDDGLSPTQRRDLEIIRALVREAQAHRVKGVPTDHDYLYDEYGLPV